MNVVLWLATLLTIYLNNRVFLSRNYRLMVVPWQFDVLKANIYYLLSLLFITKFSSFLSSIRLQLNYFQLFEMKVVKAKWKIWKRKQTKRPTYNFNCLFSTNPLVQKKFHGWFYIWLSRLLPQNLENNSIEFQLIFELACGRKFSGEQ